MDHTTPLDDVLRAGDTENLVGRLEDDNLEAKAEPYDLASPAQRCELAKDVSSFANAEGGHLLIGVSTEPDPDRATDVIDGLNLVQPEDFDEGQYQGVIKEMVYPAIAGLEVHYVAEKDGGGGIGVIFVPQQDHDRGPFLVTRVVEEGEALKENFVGYYERDGAHNRPLTAKELQLRFKTGVATTTQRLGRIEDKIDTLVERTGEPDAQGPAQNQLLAARLSQALEEAE